MAYALQCFRPRRWTGPPIGRTMPSTSAEGGILASASWHNPK